MLLTVRVIKIRLYLDQNFRRTIKKNQSSTYSKKCAKIKQEKAYLHVVKSDPSALFSVQMVVQIIFRRHVRHFIRTTTACICVQTPQFERIIPPITAERLLFVPPPIAAAQLVKKRIMSILVILTGYNVR